MALDFSFLQATSSTTNAATYTFSSQNLGTADSARKIIVAVEARINSSTPTFDSATIGGVSASIAKSAFRTNGTTSSICALIVADVPTGTTGDVVVNYSASCDRCAIQMYRAVGVDSSTPTDTAEATTGDDPTTSIDVPAGGFAIACAIMNNTGSSQITWTGLTEDHESAPESSSVVGSASDEFASAQTAMTVTTTWSTGSSINLPLLIAAAWDDAAATGSPWNYYAQQ